MDNTLNNNAEELAQENKVELEEVAEVELEVENDSMEEAVQEINVKDSDESLNQANLKEIFNNQCVLLDVVRVQTNLIKNLLQSVCELSDEVNVLNSNYKISNDYLEKAIQNINIQNGRCSDMLSTLTDNTLVLNKLSAKQVTLENNQERVVKALGKSRESIGVVAEDLSKVQDKVETLSVRFQDSKRDLETLQVENQDIKAKLSILDRIKNLIK